MVLHLVHHWHHGRILFDTLNAVFAHVRHADRACGVRLVQLLQRGPLLLHLCARIAAASGQRWEVDEEEVNVRRLQLCHVRRKHLVCVLVAGRL